MELRLLLCSSLAIVRTIAGMQCNPGFMALDDGNCYFIGPGNVPYMTAQQDCLNRGAVLASIHSERENEIVEGLALISGNPVWVGMQCSRYLDTSSCSWSDSTAVDYSNFGDGMPNPSFGSCVQMLLLSGMQGVWVSVDCEHTMLDYVCRQTRVITVPPTGPTGPTPTPNPNICPAGPFYDTLSSPGYPRNYGNNLNCIYNLSVATGPGQRLGLYFDEFKTETCCDIVYLYDGPTVLSPLIARLSGRPVTRVFYNATGPIMTVQFQTDASSTDKGWHAYFGPLSRLTAGGAQASRFSPIVLNGKT